MLYPAELRDRNVFNGLEVVSLPKLCQIWHNFLAQRELSGNLRSTAVLTMPTEVFHSQVQARGPLQGDRRA